MSADAQSAELPKGRAQPGKLAVIFDGGCPRCRSAISRMLSIADPAALELIDLQDPAVLRRFADFRPDDLLREIHVVDDTGRVWLGAGALREMLRRQPGLGRWASWLWHVPGFGFLADHLYKRVAANRHRDDAGAQPHCPVT